MTKYKTFISYSREDKEIIYPIFQIMQVVAKQIFYDATGIKPGDDWQLVILEALESCDTVILFWCSHAKNSEYVKLEYEFAINKGKKIIPILIDSTELPDEVSKFQYIDMREALKKFHISDTLRIFPFQEIIPSKRYKDSKDIIINYSQDIKFKKFWPPYEYENAIDAFIKNEEILDGVMKLILQIIKE